MITPEDFLEHSNALFAQSDKTEILLRNVARNSYYALYHKLAEFDDIPSFDKSKREFGAHELLIQQLRKCDDLDYRELGLTLSRLKASRTKADYKLSKHFSDHDARKAIKTVEKAFAEINSKNKDSGNQLESIQEQGNQAVSQKTSKPQKQPRLIVIK